MRAGCYQKSPMTASFALRREPNTGDHLVRAMVKHTSVVDRTRREALRGGGYLVLRKSARWPRWKHHMNGGGLAINRCTSCGLRSSLCGMRMVMCERFSCSGMSCRRVFNRLRSVAGLLLVCYPFPGHNLVVRILRSPGPDRSTSEPNQFPLSCDPSNHSLSAPQ